ncbi:MAG: hypothetical protein HUJ68_09815 [Clostridia bacterium]|nr:hypothetical protein [Clostridia bacterium]
MEFKDFYRLVETKLEKRGDSFLLWEDEEDFEDNPDLGTMITLCEFADDLNKNFYMLSGTVPFEGAYHARGPKFYRSLKTLLERIYNGWDLKNSNVEYNEECEVYLMNHIGGRYSSQ